MLVLLYAKRNDLAPLYNWLEHYCESRYYDALSFRGAEAVKQVDLILKGALLLAVKRQ